MDIQTLFQYGLFLYPVLVGLFAASIVTCIMAGHKLRTVEIADLDEIALFRAESIGARLNAGHSASAQALSRILEHGEPERAPFPCYEWIHFSRYCAGIFVFIGLLGTVIGIAVSVNSLHTVLQLADVSNPTQFAREFAHTMVQLLRGMRYAFYCTIGGLVCTLLISGFNAWYNRVCRRAEVLFDDIINRAVLPAYRESQVDTGTATASAAKSLSATVNKLSTTASLFSADIADATNRLATTASQTSMIANTMLEAGQTMNENLRASTNAAEIIAGGLTAQVTAFGSNLDHLETLSRALESAAAKSTEEQAGLIGGLRQATVSMEAAVRSLAEEISAQGRLNNEALRELAREINATQNSLQDLLTRFEVTLTEVTAATEGNALSKAIQDLLGKLGVMEQDNAAAHNLVARTAAMDENMQALSDGVREMVNATGFIATNVGALSTDVGQVAGRLNTMESRMNESLKKRLPRIIKRDFWIGD